MLRTCFASLCLLLIPGQAFGQDGKPFDPSGYWTGAIMKDGSVFQLSLTIEAGADGYSAETTFEDWIFYKPDTRETVTVTETGLIIHDLLSGDAVLGLEPKYEQLTGRVGDDGRTIHLKRAVPPPALTVVSTDTEFRSADGTMLAATLTMPRHGTSLGGMVMVRGRGCASRLNGRARFLAEYGLAVLTYDKRGSGESEGDCATFTFEDLTADAIAAISFLTKQERIDPKRVGFFGESAGAWTVQAATERLMADTEAVQPAYIVTWIGPATSILQQQISSAATYGAGIGLSESQQNVLADVSRIIADPSLSDNEAYERLSVFRDKAEREGWLGRGFGPDDIPRERSDMDGLWLRRFRYDPTAFLNGIGDLPYLSVLGAKDTIVPVAENVDALRQAAPHATIVVLPESGHGYDHAAQTSARIDGEPVWIFEGPDTGFTSATVQFLRENGIAER